MPKLETVDTIYQRAAKRKGGSAALNLLIGDKVDQAALALLDDAQYLSAFTKKVFQSGFVWRVVEQKMA